MGLLSGKIILVVEDDDDLRDVIMDLFVRFGATVVGAENGTKAFEIVRNNAFDCVMTDIRMPGGDGPTLLKNINAQMSIKPALFVCSGYNDLTEADLNGMGVIKVFSKPFDTRALAEEVSHSLNIGN